MLIFDISFPPLAKDAWGFRGAFGFIPTTYGTRGRSGKLGCNRTKAGRTRHGVFTEEVIDLTLGESLNV